MVAFVEVLVFFSLTVFSTVIVPFRPTVNIFCFFTEVGDGKGEILYPEEENGLGDVSGGGVIKEEEDGSVSILMVRGCNGRDAGNLGVTVVSCPFVAFRVCMFHWTSNKLLFIQ